MAGELAYHPDSGDLLYDNVSGDLALDCEEGVPNCPSCCDCVEVTLTLSNGTRHGTITAGQLAALVAVLEKSFVLDPTEPYESACAFSNAGSADILIGAFEWPTAGGGGCIWEYAFVTVNVVDDDTYTWWIEADPMNSGALDVDELCYPRTGTLRWYRSQADSEAESPNYVEFDLTYICTTWA